MKKLMINTRILAIAIVSTFALAFATPALATENPNPGHAELKYLGQIKNQPLFELTFDNTAENGYIVVIRDEFQNVLYRDFVKAGTTAKKYLLDTEEIGDVAVQFEITSRKTDKTIVYEVNKNTRFVEDLVVNKVK